MWCATRANSWTLAISDLCKQPKSSIEYIRSHNVGRPDKLFLLPHKKFFLKQLIVNWKRSTSDLKQIDYS